ncbi:hypothetical protein LXA43DRAFT_1094518 [Ganoderma leucocontextum]|nr:hypothetical protein LXA43DRAFT_1094518 [Ganoderma leucocontextum]
MPASPPALLLERVGGHATDIARNGLRRLKHPPPPIPHVVCNHQEMSTSTQLATSSAEQGSPRIPPELISLILVDLWEAPHTPQDRLALLKNVALVNRTWLTFIARITSRDVHLSKYQKTKAFLKLLPQRSPTQEPGDLFTMEANRVATHTCQSITFHVDGRIQPSFPADDTPVTIWLVLYYIAVRHHLPNLRHISISYADWEWNDIFLMFFGVGFPRYVTHLSLDYSFTAATAKVRPFDFSRAIRWIYMRSCIIVPNLRHLSLSGVPTAFVVAMLHVCPNVETLEITNPTDLSTLAPLPPAVCTLVLRHPDVALSKEKMRSWTLSAALDGGLFPSGTKPPGPQIVVRSGTPEPESFIELRRSCKRFNVDFVYERDDVRSPSS